MPEASSTTKPIGSECSTARPGRTEWRLPAASTRSMSRSTIAPATSIDAEINSLASRPAETETTTDFELHLGGALGEIDGLAHRRLDLGEIDHGAGLHAARERVAEADHLDRVGAPRQHVLRRARLEARDQAGDLAGADIERGDHRRTPRRQAASSSE